MSWQTDARVQNVTESTYRLWCGVCLLDVDCFVTAMSVIRMIKLFGWEPKVADQIASKREDELSFIRKYKILELINGNVK